MALEMFTEFWDLLKRTEVQCALVSLSGDDHLSVARQPTKYYKEIKDFLVATTEQQGI